MEKWEKFRDRYLDDYYTFDTNVSYRGLIKITPMNILCGYVELSKDHPYYGYQHSYSYDKITIEDQALDGLEVHGGVTHTGLMATHIYSPKAGADILESVDYDVSRLDDKRLLEYSIGFDCNHSNDYCPLYPNGVTSKEDWKDEDYVRSQIEYLAKQLKEVEVNINGHQALIE